MGLEDGIVVVVDPAAALALVAPKDCRDKPDDELDDPLEGETWTGVAPG